jgi:hypothetical protein
VTLQWFRRIVALCCAASVAGMIVTNIRGAIGGAMAFGMFGATAMLMLIVVNTLVRPPNQGGAQEALAAELEARVQDLIAQGAPEPLLREAVRKAVRLGQGEASARSIGNQRTNSDVVAD